MHWTLEMHKGKEPGTAVTPVIPASRPEMVVTLVIPASRPWKQKCKFKYSLGYIHKNLSQKSKS